MASFVSGGLIPAALRGTNNTHNLHVVGKHPQFAMSLEISWHASQFQHTHGRIGCF